ncbi:hypothetical protein SCATT_20690 [Streptantibioticus cattleyicolor NRRL 8057 = DSM 46488]|uniref:Uncharacterized protein n=1 Tax=Streptantibioticus cattleyicolor (strain ATCC 35852 / DSM 46488 / JCM 4925 / NBRC 14057 / NRRL 8057) TaxID=1003195 RepID=G8WZE5_STREN|nr:hypothetical protein SCATT_20690 [Streptantibioticus cattleyicolor NRRL 8057 = DSM 46488]
MEHPQRGLLLPAARAQRAAPGGTDRTGTGVVHGRCGHAGRLLAQRRPTGLDRAIHIFAG